MVLLAGDGSDGDESGVGQNVGHPATLWDIHRPDHKHSKGRLTCTDTSATVRDKYPPPHTRGIMSPLL